MLALAFTCWCSTLRSSLLFSCLIALFSSSKASSLCCRRSVALRYTWSQSSFSFISCDTSSWPSSSHNSHYCQGLHCSNQQLRSLNLYCRHSVCRHNNAGITNWSRALHSYSKCIRVTHTPPPVSFFIKKQLIKIRKPWLYNSEKLNSNDGSSQLCSNFHTTPTVLLWFSERTKCNCQHQQ